MAIQQMFLRSYGAPPQQCVSSTSNTDLFGVEKYTGTGSALTINPTNWPDITSEEVAGTTGSGGLYWTKSWDSNDNTGSGSPPGYGWGMYAPGTSNWGTATGAKITAQLSERGGTMTYPNAITAWSSTGLTMTDVTFARSGEENSAFLWKKCPYFMDIVNFSGTGSAQSISHNLDCTPAWMIIKDRGGTSGNSGDWVMYHTSAGTNKHFTLNQNENIDGSGWDGILTSTSVWNNTKPDRFKFYVGANDRVNKSGRGYTAFLFAGDVAADDFKQFGGSCNEAMIYTGTYTGNGSTNGPTITTGFRPRCIMAWCNSEKPWIAGMDTGNNATEANLAYILRPGNPMVKQNVGEDGNGAWDGASTSFQITVSNGAVNNNGSTWYYVAFR
tara:strand:+ start:130 stop:1284 length:1155 start_codon:yes stop_codon:yes gene_type:complete